MSETLGQALQTYCRRNNIDVESEHFAPTVDLTIRNAIRRHDEARFSYKLMAWLRSCPKRAIRRLSAFAMAR
jgi:hypothetical protein